MRAVGIGTGLFLALLLGTGLSSCAKGRGPAPKAANQSSGAAQAYRMTPASGTGSQGQGQKAQAVTESKPAPLAKTPVLSPGPGAPSAPRYLNLGAAPVELLPSDFGIGPLENLRSREAPQGLDPALASFLESLIAGKPRYSAVLAGRLPLVEAILDGVPPPGSPGSPVAYRLGRVKTAGEEAVAAFTLFASGVDQGGPARLPPRCDGSIHARLVGTEWRIEDLSFDASGLSSDRAFPDPPWQPPAPGSALSQGGTTTDTRP